MSRPLEETIQVDVRVSELSDRIVVVPRRSAEYHAVNQALARMLPNVRLQHRVDGLSLAAEDSPALLDVDEYLDLHWRPDARLFAENRRRVMQLHQRLHAEVKRIRDGGRLKAETYLRDVGGLSVLDDHQWVNVAAMTLPDAYGLCVFDEQGAGKTVTLIFAYDVLMARNELDVALIVAPKSMVAEWPRDFNRFMGDLYDVRVASGTRQHKLQALRSGADVIVTNFETVVTMETELSAFLRPLQGRAMLVVDESFYIKNLDAKRTRALRRLRELCRRAFVLCGTPAPNAPHDLVQQFNIVDFGLTFNGVDIPEDHRAARGVVQSAVEEKGLFVRHLKRDVLPNLAAKRFHRVIVPLEPEQRRLYLGALRGLIVDLRATDDHTFVRQLPSFLTKRSTLLRICSNPAPLVERYVELPAKLRALDNLLNEAIAERSEKVVVWSFYTASLHAIVARYGRFNPVRYDGSVGEVAERREAVRRFQEDDDTMLFVGNPAAAGAGLTLHRAHLAIYESLSNQPAHYLQSLDRIHRRGQTRDVEYLVLLCADTLELAEYDRLVDKERAAQMLLGDCIEEPITRESMLAEAVAALRMLGEKA